jgi:hypothetical protein
MTRRIVAIALWGYFGWYLASLAAVGIGLPQVIGPIGGLIIATVAAVDWRSLIRARAAAKLESAR